MTSAKKTITLLTEADTANFAAKIAGRVQAGDVILLDGEIGAGKSSFARALIRKLAGAEIDVPSPTFTLVQTYELPICDVWHCDLYRLSHPDEAFELGLDVAFDTSLCLIEWPDRLGVHQPPHALMLQFSAEKDHHTVTFSPRGRWEARLEGIDV